MTEGFSISLFSSSLCSTGQVHDYFCMNVAASISSKQKQMESECAKPKDKLKRLILELTWKMAAHGSFRTVRGPGRIGNHLLFLFLYNLTVTYYHTILSLNHRLRKGWLFVSPLKRRKCIRGRRSPD